MLRVTGRSSTGHWREWPDVSLRTVPCAQPESLCYHPCNIVREFLGLVLRWAMASPPIAGWQCVSAAF